MLRVISGKYRSRILEQPPLEITRATIDRIKEAIFNSIRFNLENKIVVDLFAGSANLAIEALSNNAQKAYAVDNNLMAIKCIENNKKNLNLTNLEIICSNAEDFLNKLDFECDYFFLDPPYKNINLLNNALKIINNSNLLSQNGLIIIETDNDKEIIIPSNLQIKRKKQYGKINIIYLEKKE
ncbi:16S rRNA (guanine(966)-N(2))-methyltransferase RsmD [Mycoplasma sp. 744]|uniref:16S rRNA (guanine(966)-N(2))-methyltransferase RsmD n=1 Tax=Mycoplasma sp. 744 TaxID=3108531 RepID=UPI002B1DE5ED|nr:16S rRNA (guanine(966)-N(2))-methyltransferase RsmD [Mycoplasma sp. 744]MEA4115420.1 16S rRNA (guanine(966)-N(2))-methyltransferase RsmD [Mycoplasma sp. 744]